jgi:hypothetical protein
MIGATTVARDVCVAQDGPAQRLGCAVHATGTRSAEWYRHANRPNQADSMLGVVVAVGKGRSGFATDNAFPTTTAFRNICWMGGDLSTPPRRSLADVPAGSGHMSVPYVETDRFPSSLSPIQELTNMLKNFINDEAGFLVSAELILVSTILVIGLIVGLIELQSAVLHELNDVGEAIASFNQSYSFPGTVTQKGVHQVTTSGSAWVDSTDINCCDCNQGVSLYCTAPVAKEGGGANGTP